MTPRDRLFLTRARKIVEQHVGDHHFDVQQFVNELGYSRTQTHRKIKQLADRSCSLFILEIRLKHAARLLRTEANCIYEIASRVGFNHHSYFTKCFKEKYGCLPREYRICGESLNSDSMVDWSTGV